VIALALVIAGATYTPPPCKDFAPGGDRRCAVADFGRADRRMRLAFQRAVQRLRSCRPLKSTRCYDRTGAMRVFNKEQQTWTAWRDAHCDVVAFSVGGSSAEMMVRMDCRTELTLARIKEIEAVGKD
jgi:uncharacterized protein YecT (DUF1311 family)